MSNRPPTWIDPLMRFGYTARGFVYVILGGLAFVAWVDGGRTPDSKSALDALLQMPFGKMLLALIALGLVAYSLWCFIGAGMDLDNKGADAKYPVTLERPCGARKRRSRCGLRRPCSCIIPYGSR